jgi:hypothetical protein
LVCGAEPFLFLSPRGGPAPRRKGGMRDRIIYIHAKANILHQHPRSECGKINFGRGANAWNSPRKSQMNRFPQNADREIRNFMISAPNTHSFLFSLINFDENAYF